MFPYVSMASVQNEGPWLFYKGKTNDNESHRAKKKRKERKNRSPKPSQLNSKSRNSTNHSFLKSIVAVKLNYA